LHDVPRQPSGGSTCSLLHASTYTYGALKIISACSGHGRCF
jgi:hypothetical protein